MGSARAITVDTTSCNLSHHDFTLRYVISTLTFQPNQLPIPKGFPANSGQVALGGSDGPAVQRSSCSHGRGATEQARPSLARGGTARAVSPFPAGRPRKAAGSEFASRGTPRLHAPTSLLRDAWQRKIITGVGLAVAMTAMATSTSHHYNLYASDTVAALLLVVA